MEISYYLNNIDYGEIVLILGSRYNKRIGIKGSTVYDFFHQVATDEKIKKVSKMLGIEQETLEKKSSQVTNLENALIIIAFQLLKGKELVINYLDVLLNYKEEIYLKRVLSKLSHQYKVKIAIFTNNISFCFHLIDRILIVKDREIRELLSNDFYNMEIYKYIDMPDIIDFVKNTTKKKLDKYTDLSELLKGLYRTW